ncbi:rubrerythrin family protein [Candidatus Velamenicoccus archaeovorus]|uniref:Rubrerythrin family protein n=1 Tax=Velamenicoccus archaeovorus TaxID=1930593 RepID=A0A410P758_VELA1|nr:VIT1/CCC1 transporter family protein [Candidatus Velamenicoccus archaeovorus]QAT18046.1 rubrerythrin family protein [Candidatus Velamenicoccus archaeovorus]
MLTAVLQAKVKKAQSNEMTEHVIYSRLASAAAPAHRAVLEKIAAEELRHHDFFKGLTGEGVEPNRTKALFFVFLARTLGLNFALRLLESGEDAAQDYYGELRSVSCEIDGIIRDEKDHEERLLGMIDEERLQYVSSMVLGLNDALVELTGALVGFTLALQKTRLVAIVGLITGIAASLSMASAEYLSTKHEKTSKSPLKASIYTGLTYVATVTILVLPYFIFSNIYACLSWVVLGALLIVFLFTFYISVAKNLDFKKRFLEMAGLSLTIAALNFAIGLVIRKVFGIDV